MGDEIDVEVQLFARLRETCGNRSSLSLRLPARSTPEACFELLCRDFSAVRPQRQGLAVAVNEEYAAWDRQLDDGDEVSFIPPVSGG